MPARLMPAAIMSGTSMPAPSPLADLFAAPSIDAPVATNNNYITQPTAHDHLDNNNSNEDYFLNNTFNFDEPFDFDSSNYA